jgi:hypothetical protein
VAAHTTEQLEKTDAESTASYESPSARILSGLDATDS